MCDIDPTEYMDDESRHLYEICVVNHANDLFATLKALRTHPDIRSVQLVPEQFEVFWRLPPHQMFATIAFDPADHRIYATEKVLRELLPAITRHAGFLRPYGFLDLSRLHWVPFVGST